MRTRLLPVALAVLALVGACGASEGDDVIVDVDPVAPATTNAPTTEPDSPTTTAEETLPPSDADGGGGASAATGEELERELAGARERWAATGPASYTMELGVVCSCPVELAGPFVVEVEGGSVASLAFAESSPATGDVPAGAAVMTVEQIFDEIASWIGQADEVRVTYDTDTGVPTDVWIDPSFQRADEELGFTLSLVDPAA